MIKEKETLFLFFVMGYRHSHWDGINLHSGNWLFLATNTSSENLTVTVQEWPFVHFKCRLPIAPHFIVKEKKTLSNAKYNYN